jgi:glycerol dehydrogenase
MKRLRAMREPLKYAQGKDALIRFWEEMNYMGKRWLFVCSNSGYKACHDKLEKSFEAGTTTEDTRSSAASPATARCRG